jgi:hypothetical protein
LRWSQTNNSVVTIVICIYNLMTCRAGGEAEKPLIQGA